MLFGGETLQDFAFALLVGIASGTYSSIFIATPVLAHWKEREPVYRARRAARSAASSAASCRRTRSPTGGEPVDVAPKDARRAAAGVTAPAEPERGLAGGVRGAWSRDLGVDEAPRAARAAAAGRAPAPPPRRRPPRPRARPTAGARPPAPATPAADGAGDDGTTATSRRSRRSARKPRNRRHGRPR